MSKCNGCRCQDVGCGTEHCDDLHKHNDEKIERAGKVIKDTEVCDLPKLISKGVENIWCVFKNIIHNICCLSNRMDCVEEKEYRIGTGIECIDPRITTLNMLITYINSGRVIDNKKLQAELDAWKKKVAEVQKHNAQEQNRFVAEYNKYQQDLAEAESKIHTDGYASQTFTQTLSLPTGGVITEVLSTNIHEIPFTESGIENETSELWTQNDWYVGTAKTVLLLQDNHGGVNEQGRIFRIPLNQTLKLKTKVPEGSTKYYYKNEYVDTMEISFTNKASSISSHNMYISIYKKDTLSFNVVGTHWNTTPSDNCDVEIKVKLFNSSGVQIQVGSDAYVALNSLNSERRETTKHYEYAIAPSYIYITGSTVKANSDGKAYAGEIANNDYRDTGWDNVDSPLLWFGSIIGNVSNQPNGVIDVHFGTYDKNWAWFKLDTHLSSTVTPQLPEPINRLPIPNKPAGEIQDLLDFSDGVSCLDKLDDPDSCINAHTERNPKHHL